jgi:UTP--glucose-1-phosphate uridylyltransferase
MVKKAVIPAAGLGTRFLPATKAQPKEMMPIVDTPAIQYVVQEAVDSGIDDVLIVSGKGKRAIEDHFDRNPELENHLESREDADAREAMRRIADLAAIHYIRQKEQNGLGDAIRYARRHVGAEPFAVLLGDTIVDSAIPATQQLIDAYEQYRQPVIAVEEVPREKVHRYGIVGVKPLGGRAYQITDLVEKPSPDEAPSNFAVAGRYVLTPDIFACIDRTKPGKNNEIQITDALRLLLKTQPMVAVKFEGKRYDIGNKLDYLKTIVEFALKRKEFAEPFLKFLRETAEKNGAPRT